MNPEIGVEELNTECQLLATSSKQVTNAVGSGPQPANNSPLLN